jgi:hypothetical protein
MHAFLNIDQQFDAARRHRGGRNRDGRERRARLVGHHDIGDACHGKIGRHRASQTCCGIQHAQGGKIVRDEYRCEVRHG